MLFFETQKFKLSVVCVFMLDEFLGEFIIPGMFTDIFSKCDAKLLCFAHSSALPLFNVLPWWSLCVFSVFSEFSASCMLTLFGKKKKKKRKKEKKQIYVDLVLKEYSVILITYFYDLV